MRRKKKPITPGTRHQIRRTYAGDEQGGRQRVPRELRQGKRSGGGRNNRGRITVRHRGGEKKRLRRARYPYTTKGKVWDRGKGRVVGRQYDPNRSARLALVEWMESGKKEYAYFLAADGLRRGSLVYVGSGSRQEKVQGEFGGRGRNQVGTTRPLLEIPIGSQVFNVELEPGKGGKYVRSAGTSATRLRKPEGQALLRLPSGTRIQVPQEARATLGQVGGQEHRMESRGKAGRNRNRGIRPTVRGEAMNPIDHPHGGRTRGGRPELTPWGRRAKGVPTRNRKTVSKWRVQRST